MVVNNVANVLTAPLYVAFTSLLGINYLVSNILTLGIVFIGRFAIAERIWGGGAAGGTGTDVGPSHADAVTPTERGAADDDVIELRTRVAKLETASGQHRAPNAKWFPAG
jgi:hypothetical protein